jgi:hypothetical protein
MIDYQSIPMKLVYSQIIWPGPRKNQGFWVSMTWKDYEGVDRWVEINLPQARADAAIFREHYIPRPLESASKNQIMFWNPLHNSVHNAYIRIEKHGDIVSINCTGNVAFGDPPLNETVSDPIRIEESIQISGRSEAGIARYE